jgi:DNA-binding FadR family transcriptional regulator
VGTNSKSTHVADGALMDVQDDVARVRAYIDARRREGLQRLPPEEKFAEEVGVARSRLRGILKRLENEGVIWRHVGKGTFIGERSMASALGALPSMISPLEAFDARMVLEPQLAALAAMNASPREIHEMQECLQTMAKLERFEEWAVWDERLHRLVAKAARNTLLLAVYDTIRQSAPSGMSTRLNTVYSGGVGQRTNVEHDRYVEAIANRDPQGAETAMRDHLKSVRATLFDR